jgi:CheY-like chemotaxis protein
MEAVGRLAGGIAHDFNNLLTAIIGNAESLRDQLDPNDPRREDSVEIIRAGERAAVLTRQLLAFSRQQVLAPRVVDLAAVVRGTQKMLERVIGEDIKLVTRLDFDTGHVFADPSQIEQVILNLAVNSRDAMPDGGTLTIETKSIDLDEQYANTHPPAEPGAYVMLGVTDTGTGMTREVQTRIFEPFFTTKEAGKGTGLGLATVYGIVKQSAGYIWLYSEPDHGATFKVYLPRVSTDAQPLPAPAPVLSTGGTETLLLAEDDPMVRRLALRALEKLGYRVLSAEDAAHALDLAEKHHGKIDLLITDVVMPGMSGPQLAKRLVAQRPSLKVLYTSGYAGDAIVRHGIPEAGVEFLQKPYTPMTLASRVRQLLEGRMPADHA